MYSATVYASVCLCVGAPCACMRACLCRPEVWVVGVVRLHSCMLRPRHRDQGLDDNCLGLREGREAAAPAAGQVGASKNSYLIWGGYPNTQAAAACRIRARILGRTGNQHAGCCRLPRSRALVGEVCAAARRACHGMARTGRLGWPRLGGGYGRPGQARPLQARPTQARPSRVGWAMLGCAGLDWCRSQAWLDN